MMLKMYHRFSQVALQTALMSDTSANNIAKSLGFFYL